MRPSDPGQRVKGVHSDRRPGVCCDGVNQTYHVTLRVVDAHGLTEVIGAATVEAQKRIGEEIVEIIAAM